MNAMAWIILCLFASLGIAQAAGWLLGRSRRPPGVRDGYYVIPLYDDPETTEAQLRYSISRLRWCGYCGEHVMVLDMGADPESLAICEELMCRYGLFYSRQSQFFDTIRKLDAMQDQKKRT